LASLFCGKLFRALCFFSTPTFACASLTTMATEYEELDESLNKKITELATLIKGAKHAVISTGAGISVSASIPGQ
jgi:hypothetical protein